MWREAARYEPRMGEDERRALLVGLASGARALARLGSAGRGPGRVTAAAGRG